MAVTPSQYCDLEDLFTVGLPRSAVEGSEDEITSVMKAIRSASSDMNSYLGNRYVLPLIAWDDSLRSKCAAITAWYLMRGTGFNPEGGGDSTLRMGYEDAMKWLKDVVDHRASPQVTDSSTSPTPGQSSFGAPRCYSGSGRGYSTRQTNRGPGGFTGD